MSNYTDYEPDEEDEDELVDNGEKKPAIAVGDSAVAED